MFPRRTFTQSRRRCDSAMRLLLTTRDSNNVKDNASAMITCIAPFVVCEGVCILSYPPPVPIPLSSPVTMLYRSSLPHAPSMGRPGACPDTSSDCQVVSCLGHRCPGTATPDPLPTLYQLPVPNSWLLGELIVLCRQFFVVVTAE